MNPKPLVPPKKPREISRLLEAARDAIQRNDLPSGLRTLDQAAAISVGDSEAGSKVLCLLGDAELRKADFISATGYYERGGNLVANQRRAWMRPLFGQLIAALHQEDFERAKVLAQEVASRAESVERTFRSELKDFAKKLSKGEEMIVAKRPARLSVILSRLGLLFLNAGDLETAQRYFEKTLETNPVGGCRARLGLAEIAHKTGDFAQAAALSRDAIIRGKFQAKTLSGWPIHLDANGRQGKPLVDQELLDGVAGANATVRDRARLAILTRLRGANAEGWLGRAQAWAETASDESPSIAVEIYKLISSAKIAMPERAVQLAALALRDLPLAEQEWVSIARRESRLLASSGGRLNYEDTLREGERRFGVESALRIARSIALLAAANSDNTYALEILDRAIQTSSRGSEEWARTLWCKAKLLLGKGRKLEAAEGFQAYALEKSLPLKWRLFAISQWLQCSEGEETDLPSEAWELVDHVSRTSDDYRLLLDLADHLRRQAPETEALRERLMSRGASIAKERIFRSPVREEASLAFHKLTRRWNCNSNFSEIIELWETIPDQRKQFLWSFDYFEGVRFVVRAYCSTEKLPTAIWLVNDICSNASTPWQAVTRLEVTLAFTFLIQKRLQDAFAIFDPIANSSNSEEFAAYAHYWVGLRKMKRGDVSGAHRHCRRIQQILGIEPRLAWKKSLTQIADLLLSCASMSAVFVILRSEETSDTLVQFRGNWELIG